MNNGIKIILCALAVCLTGSFASAQQANLSIAKGQARRAAGGNPAPNAPAPATPSPSPVDPALAATLKNIGDLQADFAVITAADADSAMSQRISLLNHLSSAAQGAKASSANIRQLAGNLIAALAGHKKAGESDQKLAQAVHALFNGAHLSAGQQESLLAEIKKILTDAGVASETADKVTDNLKAIAVETK